MILGDSSTIRTSANWPMSKILADTNILVYATDRSSRFHQRSLEFLTSQGQIHLPSKVLVEFFAVVTRAPVSSLPVPVALSSIEWFTSQYPVIHPNADSQRILWEMTRRPTLVGLRIHDGEIASIGLAHGIRRLATFNVRDFAGIDGIEIVDLNS